MFAWMQFKYRMAIMPTPQRRNPMGRAWILCKVCVADSTTMKMVEFRKVMLPSLSARICCCQFFSVGYRFTYAAYVLLSFLRLCVVQVVQTFTCMSVKKMNACFFLQQILANRNKG